MSSNIDKINNCIPSCSSDMNFTNPEPIANAATRELNPIHSSSKERIVSILDQKIEIRRADGKVITKPFTLREFFKYIIDNSKVKIGEIFLIGGSVPSILGIDYYLDNMKEMTFEEQVSLDKELKLLAPDVDFRPVIESDDPVRSLWLIVNTALIFFAKHHIDYNENNFYPTFHSFKKHGFTKLKMCDEPENKFLIMSISPKDSCPIEFTFTCMMKSQSLVEHNGLKLPILSFIDDANSEITPCESSGDPFRSLEARAKKILRFGPDVNMPGWFKIHLWMLLGYSINHPDSRKQLSEGLGENPTYSDIDHMIKHTLDNHPVNLPGTIVPDPLAERLLLVNIAYSLKRVLTDDQLALLAVNSPLLRHRAVFPILEIVGAILSVQESFGSNKKELSSHLVFSEYPSVQLNFSESGNALYTQFDLNLEKSFLELESLLKSDVDVHLAQEIWNELIGLIPLRDKVTNSASKQTFKVECQTLVQTLNKKMFSPHPLMRLMTFYLLCFAKRMHGEYDLDQQIGMMVPALIASYPNKKDAIILMALNVLGDKYASPLKSLRQCVSENEIYLFAYWIEACMQSSRVTIDLQIFAKNQSFSSVAIIQLIEMLSPNALFAKVQLLKCISLNDRDILEQFTKTLFTLLNEMTIHRATKHRHLSETRVLVGKMIIRLNRVNVNFTLNASQKEILFSYLFSLVILSQDEAIKELLLSVSNPNSPLFLQQQAGILWDEFMSKSLLESQENWMTLAPLYQSLNLPEANDIFSFLFLESLSHMNTGELAAARKNYSLLVSISSSPRQKILLERLLTSILDSLLERAFGWDIEQAYTLIMLSYFNDVIKVKQTIMILNQLMNIIFKEDSSYSIQLRERIMMLILTFPLDSVDPKSNLEFSTLAARGILKICQANPQFLSSQEDKLQNAITFILLSFEGNNETMGLIRFFQICSHFGIKYTFEKKLLPHYVELVRSFLVTQNRVLVTHEVFKLLLCWGKNGSQFQNYELLSPLNVPLCDRILQFNVSDPFFDTYLIQLTRFILSPENISYVLVSKDTSIPFITSLVKKLASAAMQNQRQINHIWISSIFELLKYGEINDINLWYEMLNLGLNDESVNIRIRQSIIKDFISLDKNDSIFKDVDQKIRAMCWELCIKDFRFYEDGEITFHLFESSEWILNLFKDYLGMDWFVSNAPVFYDRVCQQLKSVNHDHWRKLLVIREMIETECLTFEKSFPRILHHHTRSLILFSSDSINSQLRNQIIHSMNRSILSLIQVNLIGNLDSIYEILGNVFHLWGEMDQVLSPSREGILETLNIFQNYISDAPMSIQVLFDLFKEKIPNIQDEAIAALELWYSKNLSKSDNFNSFEIGYLVPVFKKAASELKGDNLYRLARLAMNLYHLLNDEDYHDLRVCLCNKYLNESELGAVTKFAMFQHTRDYVKAYPDSFNEDIVKRMTFKLWTITKTIQISEFDEFIDHFEELLFLKTTCMHLGDFINIAFPCIREGCGLDEKQLATVMMLYERLLLNYIQKDAAKRAHEFTKELFCRYLLDWVEIYPEDGKLRTFHFKRAQSVLNALPAVIRDNYPAEINECEALIRCMLLENKKGDEKIIGEMLNRFVDSRTVKGVLRFCFVINNGKQSNKNFPIGTKVYFEEIFQRDPGDWLFTESRNITDVNLLANAFMVFIEPRTLEEKKNLFPLIPQFYKMVYGYLQKIPDFYQGTELGFSLVWICMGIAKVYSSGIYNLHLETYVRHVERTLDLVSNEFKKFSFLESDILINYLYALQKLIDPIITSSDVRMKKKGYQLCDKYLLLVSNHEKDVGEPHAGIIRINVVNYFKALHEPTQFDKYVMHKLGPIPLRDVMLSQMPSSSSSSQGRKGGRRRTGRK